MLSYGESKSTLSYVLYVKYEYDEYTSNVEYVLEVGSMILK